MVWKNRKTHTEGFFERNIEEFNIVAVNDLGNIKSNIHLLKYDSVHGTFLYQLKMIMIQLRLKVIKYISLKKQIQSIFHGKN